MSTENKLDFAKKQKNLMYMFLDTSSASTGTVSFPGDISVQTICIKAIRVHFDTQGHANASNAQKLHLKLTNIFGPQQAINNINFPCIPIFHDSTKHDSTFYPDIKISMSKKIPSKLRWELVDETNALLSFNGELNFIQVLIEYEIEKI